MNTLDRPRNSHHQNSRDDYPAPTGYAEVYGNRWMPPDLAALGGTSADHLPGYCGMVKRLDEALGRIEDALRSTGQLENTLLVFTSDHGCHFKTRNGEYKRSPHDGSLRVPLMLHGPGFMGGGDLDRMVSLIDLPPTLLTAAGISPPECMDGTPLQQPPSDSDEVFVQISESSVARALRTRQWKYAVTAPDAHPWDDPGSDHYIESHLYDLQNDPWEMENLFDSPAHAPIREVLRCRLLERMKQAGEPPATVAPAG